MRVLKEHQEESLMYPRKRMRQSPGWEFEMLEIAGRWEDPGSVGGVDK
jgi:hypothetical protein